MKWEGKKEREVEEENEKWQGWVCKRKQIKNTWASEQSVGKNQSCYLEGWIQKWL